MKKSTSSLFFATGAAVALALSSCVAPYDAYGSTTVTTYSPGYRASTLPSGYRTEIIGSRTYYYHNGAYYNRERQGGYVVVDAPRSSRYHDDWNHHHRTENRDQRDYRDQRGHRNDNRVITRLPNGYRTVNHRGQQYYTQGNRYYQRQGSGYISVNAPF